MKEGGLILEWFMRHSDAAGILNLINLSPDTDSSQKDHAVSLPACAILTSKPETCLSQLDGTLDYSFCLLGYDLTFSLLDEEGDSYAAYVTVMRCCPTNTSCFLSIWGRNIIVLDETEFLEQNLHSIKTKI